MYELYTGSPWATYPYDPRLNPGEGAPTVVTAGDVAELKPLSTWKRRERRRLTRAGHHLLLDPGEVLYRDGDTAYSAFLVLAGQGSIAAPGQPSAALEPGVIIGAQDLLLDRPRGATVRALGAVELLRYSKPAFLELAEKLPRVWDLVLEDSPRPTPLAA